MKKSLQIPQAVKDALMDRCGGRCERCSSYTGLDPHHRLKKGMGGTRDPQSHTLVNLLALCRQCHRWVEHEGVISGESYDKGWLVKRRRDFGPAAIPVQYRDNPHPQMLGEDGSIRDATDEELLSMLSAQFGYTVGGEVT